MRQITSVPKERWLIQDRPELQIPCLACGQPIIFFSGDNAPDYHRDYRCGDWGKRRYVERTKLRKLLLKQIKQLMKNVE